MKRFFLYIIRVYQKTLSPDSGWFSYKHPHGYCKFYPHCSEYSYQAIEKYGIFNGFYRSIKRIIKCNPLSKGGYDPLN